MKEGSGPRLLTRASLRNPYNSRVVFLEKAQIIAALFPAWRQAKIGTGYLGNSGSQGLGSVDAIQRAGRASSWAASFGRRARLRCNFAAVLRQGWRTGRARAR